MADLGDTARRMVAEGLIDPSAVEVTLHPTPFCPVGHWGLVKASPGKFLLVAPTQAECDAGWEQVKAVLLEVAHG